jgi:hypothetical protein
MNLLLRVVLVLAGLVFAASLAAAGAVMLALWGARAAWARLTGRPVAPFVVRMRPSGAFSAFGGMMARAPHGSRTPRADALGARTADVSDVEPKRPVR